MPNTQNIAGLNAPFPYFGGKSRLAQEIIARVPQHKTYAEVFGGAAWILFKKPPTGLEALNDLDRHLMNFYRVARFHPETLIEEVCALQPSRDLFYQLRDDLDRPTMTDIQRAAVYFYLQRYAFAGRPNKPTLATSPNRPPRCRPDVARRTLPMVAERLKSVMLEALPWDRFIALYDSPDTFFFVDPPYWGHNEYRHNFKADDFIRLAAVLITLKGRFLMTHTDSPKIRNLFAGLKVEPVTALYSASRQSGGPGTAGREVFITNY